jgi:hypothetical protein
MSYGQQPPTLRAGSNHKVTESGGTAPQGLPSLSKSPRLPWMRPRARFEDHCDRGSNYITQQFVAVVESCDIRRTVGGLDQLLTALRF